MTRARLAVAVVAAAVATSGCATDFEEPSIVLDLRALSMTAEPPEVVAPVDLEHPTAVDLPDVQVCALVADPGASRRLRWQMIVCPPTSDRRCDEPADPQVEMGFGAIDDPDQAAATPLLCATITPSAGMLAVLQESVSADSLLGFGGVAVQVELVVTADDGSDAAEHAAKRVVYAPIIPADRVANQNPWMEAVVGGRADDGPGRENDFSLTPARCTSPDARPLRVAPGELIALAPAEPPGVREDYVLPTFDGGERRFTENLTYAWYATAGHWSGESTGGPKDAFGNQPRLDTTWTAPSDPAVVGGGLDVAMWVVQRDERGGQSWLESCVHVAP